jgi:hypothetical protein
VPPPGITNVTIGRNKNGLLAVAQLQISIPSLLQLESLHRTFLIPGVGMILEWGQQFAPYSTNDIYLQKTDITPHLFPWTDRFKLENIMNRLARRDVGLMEILENYVYPSNGQYMWMFGRVGTFDIKSNSDGSFTSTVKIIGQSEDAWAYSVRNTVVPRRDSSSQLYCASDTNSVYSYFTNTMAGGFNLKSLLDDVLERKIPELSDWKEHVVYFEQGNQSTGEPTPSTETKSIDEKTFADHQDAYFMTWRFFVNVVINHPVHGIKGIFSRAGLSADLVNSIGLLMPYGEGESRNTSIGKLKIVDDPKESFVGANKYLRSTDPSVLVIVNEKAVELAANNVQYTVPVKDVTLLEPTNDSRQFTNATAPFDVAASEYHVDTVNPDRGFLSSGVWLNHKAVVESMIGADTILRGITKLLDRMNQATENYWQLTLDVIDGESGKNPQSYAVIDANFRDNSTNAVKNFIDNVHIFNKYIRSSSTGELVGSELIECNIDLSLPKRLFGQIGTLGLISPQDITNIQRKELKVGDIAGGENDGDTAFSAKVSDPNNTLAEMFGIISLSLKGDPPQYPDLTILSNAQDGNINSTCGKAIAQLPATVGGQGYQVADINPLENLSKSPDERKAIFESSSFAVNSVVCRQCEPCNTAEELVLSRSNIRPVDGVIISEEYDTRFPGLRFRSDVRNGRAISLQLLSEVSSAFLKLSGGTIRGFVNSGHRTPGESIPTSRHISGLAIDISAVVKGDEVLSVTTPEGGEIIDEVVKILGLLQYKPVRSEQAGATPKAIMWRVPGHNNHIHISLYAATTTAPTPPPATSPPTKVDTCTREDYVKIGNGNDALGRELCRRCKNHTEVVRQVTKTTQTAVEATVRKFSGLRQSLRYVEIFPEMMVASITANANGDRSNAFGASPGSLSIAGDLVLPGINGLRVGELFWIDRVPAFYKVFGAFQVLSIEDTIGTDGWKTKIHARFNYLGTAWKRAMVELLK